jgi:hypothetical protein
MALKKNDRLSPASSFAVSSMRCFLLSARNVAVLASAAETSRSDAGRSSGSGRYSLWAIVRARSVGTEPTIFL